MQRELLLIQGKTVLVTAHTHAAVDNMMRALKCISVPVHRIGRSESVHCDVEENVVTGPIVDVMLQMKGSGAAVSAGADAGASGSSSNGCVIGCTCLGVQVKFQSFLRKVSTQLLRNSSS